MEMNLETLSPPR